jgi:integrase
MAYLKKAANGAWRAQIDKKGVRKSASFETKAAAQAWATKVEAEINAGEHSKWPRKTLADALEKYVATVSPTKRGTRTEQLRADALLRDFPDLAAMVLHEIDSSHLAEWRDARLRVVDPSTVKRDINMFRNVWTFAAKEWKWCPVDSPWRLIGIPKDAPARDRVMSWREIRAVARRCHYRTRQPPASGLQNVAWALLVALRTGMRAGEIMGLTVSAVDLRHGIATVRHKLQHITGKPRKVPLPPAGLRLIRQLVEDAKAKGRENLWTIKSTSLDALFRKVRDQLLLSDLHFHDSRGTALTALARRVDVMTLARISGHLDLNQLLRTYYRETDQAIAGRLARRPTGQPAPRSTSAGGG